jgi:Schlafen, AlbA_2
MASAYLGPDKGRWTPATWADVVAAAASGLLDESHWVELKRELPLHKRTINTEHAQDLASLAVESGLLVIGIEDHDSHAGKVCGVELAGLADRVGQIARDKVHPSLVVRSREVPDPSRPGWGCLLVHVPRSPEAPHMVDNVYYGRGDRANFKLSDEQVRTVMEDRRRGRIDAVVELRQMADDDPMSVDARQRGHLYLLAQPEANAPEALVDLLARPDVAGVVNEINQQLVRERGIQFEPDVRQLPSASRRAEGLALTSYFPEDGIRSEVTLVELVIREDGGIRLTCGRGTDRLPGQPWEPPEQPPAFIIPILVLGLAHSVAALAGRLGDAYAAYQGQWSFGIRMDRLNGAVPADYRQAFPHSPGNPYSRPVYEKITSATTEELINAPNVVAERLVAPLLRGLGIAPRYLPYKPS